MFRRRLAVGCGLLLLVGCRKTTSIGGDCCDEKQDAGPLAIASAVPLDLPRADASDVQTIFSVVLMVDGTVWVDAKKLANDDELLGLARAARETNPEIRAVIKADAMVPHGRVIHVLDMLKQARIGKIAFGAQPIAP